VAVIELTKDNFEDTINNHPIVVIDFWAPWCGPCRTFAPVFEQAAERHPDVVFARINTDEQEELATMFEIQSIPTLVVFREQIGIFSQPGTMPSEALDNVIEQTRGLDMDDVREQIAEAEANGETDDGDEQDEDEDEDDDTPPIDPKDLN